MSKNKTPTPMNPNDARRIQGHADRNGRNQDFKSRAQRAGARNGGASKGGNKGN